MEGSVVGGIVASITMEVKRGQPQKAPPPINVMPLGMVTEVKPPQPENVELSILLILGGMVTEVKPLQLKYLEVIDYQLFVVNTVEKWIGFYLWVHGK